MIEIYSEKIKSIEFFSKYYAIPIREKHQESE
jgi:hypothetical protein